jgi:hypothetical protein
MGSRAYSVAMAATAVALAACASTRVQVAYDAKADFGRYRTFQLVEGRIEPPAAANDGADTSADVARIIDAELRRKGLVSSSERPDLVVGFVVLILPPHAIELGVGGDVAFESSDWWSAHNSGLYRVVIEFTDAQSAQLVCRLLGEVIGEGSLQGSLREAATKAMKRYPPKG